MQINTKFNIGDFVSVSIPHFPVYFGTIIRITTITKPIGDPVIQYDVEYPNKSRTIQYAIPESALCRVPPKVESIGPLFKLRDVVLFKDDEGYMLKGRIIGISVNDSLYTISTFRNNNYGYHITVTEDMLLKYNTPAISGETVGHKKFTPNGDGTFTDITNSVGESLGDITREQITELATKGAWVLERSSGYAGYRCTTCKTWVYQNHDKVCACDMEHKFNCGETVRISCYQGTHKVVGIPYLNSYGLLCYPVYLQDQETVVHFAEMHLSKEALNAKN